MNQKFKKASYIILVVCLVLAVLCVSAFATKLIFRDSVGHWAEDAIQKLTDEGIISGFPDGLSHPDEIITRAEFSTLLAKTLENKKDSSADISSGFTDIKGHWAEKNIVLLTELNIILKEEYPGNRFAPDEPITRLEMIKMLVRTLGLKNHSADCMCELDFTDAQLLNKNDKLYLCIGEKYYIISGYPDGTVKPDSNATRGEAFEMLVKQEEAKDQIQQEEETQQKNQEKLQDKQEEVKQPPVVKPGKPPSGGSNSGGGSSYVPLPPVPEPQYSFVLPKTAYVGEEIKISPQSKYVTSVTWNVSKNDIPQELSAVIGGELKINGGTVKIKENGTYTFTAVAKNSRGKEITYQQTIAVYPMISLDFILPKTAHTDTSIAVNLKTENLGEKSVVWSLKKDDKVVELENAVTGKLDNTGGTVQFKEKGNYELTATLTDELGKVVAVSRVVDVYPIAEIKLNLPAITHTDKAITLKTENKNTEDLSVKWSLIKDGKAVDLTQFIEGNLSLNESNIRFTEKGVYQLTVALTDITKREFSDTTKVTVYPVGSAGFYLPSILHTDDTVKVEATFGEIGTHTALWTLEKDGKAVDIASFVYGSLTNDGGTVQFQEKGNYILKASFIDDGGRLYTYQQHVKIYPIPTVTYTQPEYVHTDTEIEIQVNSKDLGDLTLEWLVDNTFGHQDWNTFVSGILDNNGGNISFKRAGIYELVCRATDETGRVFLFEPRRTTEVLPVLSINFALPEVAYTDTTIDLRTSGHNNALPVEWSLTKNGQSVTTNAVIDGTLNAFGGKVQFKEYGEFVLTATMTDFLDRSYTHNETITIMPVIDFAFTMPQEVHYGTDFAVNIVNDSHTENAAITWKLTKNDEPASYRGTLTADGGNISIYDTGIFTLTSTATDSLGRDNICTQEINVTNTPPTITSLIATPSRTVKDGKFFVTITASATDLNGDNTVLEWQGKTDDGYYAVGTHSVQVRAKDIAGAYSDWSEKTFTVVNSAPNITNFTATPTRTVKDGKFLVNISATATDEDGDSTQLEWLNKPADNYYAVGTHTIKVRAKDTAGAYCDWAEKTFTVVNSAPNITNFTATPTRTVKDGKFLVNIFASATDSDGDATLLEWQNKTADNYYPIGTHTVKVRAKDTIGAYSGWVEKIFVVSSSAPTRPTITRSPNANSVVPGTPVTITAQSSDADGDAITYVWEGRSKESNIYPLGKNVVRVKAVDSTGAESPWAAIVFFVMDSNGSGGMMLTGPDSTILENGIEGATITNYTFTVPPVTGHTGNDFGRVRGYNILTKQWGQLDYGTTKNGITFERNLNSGLYSKLEFYYFTNHNCMYSKSNITYTVNYYFE